MASYIIKKGTEVYRYTVEGLSSREVLETVRAVELTDEDKFSRSEILNTKGFELANTVNWSWFRIPDPKWIVMGVSNRHVWVDINVLKNR